MQVRNNGSQYDRLAIVVRRSWRVVFYEW